MFIMGEEDNLSERRKKKAIKNKNHRKALLNLSQKSSASQSPLKRKKDKKQRRGHGRASKDGTAQGSSNILKKNVKAGESSNHHQTSRQQTSSLRFGPASFSFFLCEIGCNNLGLLGQFGMLIKDEYKIHWHGYLIYHE